MLASTQTEIVPTPTIIVFTMPGDFCTTLTHSCVWGLSQDEPLWLAPVTLVYCKIVLHLVRNSGYTFFCDQLIGKCDPHRNMDFVPEFGWRFQSLTL